MLFRSIKHTLYSIALSALVLTVAVKSFSIHVRSEAVADMALIGVLVAPFIVLLNYIVLPRMKEPHRPIDASVPPLAEIDPVSACDAEASNAATTPAPRMKAGSGIQ